MTATRFEIFGFFTGREDGSDRHKRIVKACDHFFYIGGTGAREAAAQIREAEIDILVDLNGQTMGWRPAILKHRPAPVIATYLGYAGTIGADFVDYIIGDRYVTPFEMAPAMAEKIVQLPHSFWPTDPAKPCARTCQPRRTGTAGRCFRVLLLQLQPQDQAGDVRRLDAVAACGPRQPACGSGKAIRR